MTGPFALRALLLLSVLGGCSAATDHDPAPATSEDAVNASSTPAEVARVTGEGPLRVSASHVYFRDHRSQSIRRVPRTGGPAETVLTAPPDETLGDFALDDAHVYAVTVGSASLGHVVRAPLAGGPLEPMIDAEMTFTATLAMDATHVYVAARSRVVRFSKIDFALGAELIADDQEQPFGVAVDGADVYWLTLGPPSPALGCFAGAGKVQARPKSGGPARVVVQGEDCPMWLGLDEGSVYWLTFDGKLRSAATSGGPKQTIASSVVSTNAAFDSAAVYFAASSALGTHAYAASKLTGSAQPVWASSVTGSERITTFAAHGGDLFYVAQDYPESRILRLR